jgi:UDP-N-acetylmuramoylalanine-D-glutamate ligase
VSLPRAAPRPPTPRGPFLVAGLGIAGLAAAAAIAERSGPEHVVAWGRTLARPFEDRAAALRERGVTLAVGGDGVDLLDGRGCVVKSPGIPDDEPLIAAAARRGVELIDEAELAWRDDDRPWVGVTGTNGKSTVCSLIAAALAAAGHHPASAGNREGGPALSELAHDAASDVVVAELSSFQLRHAPELLPEVAVLTNCTHDSWARHGGRAGYERDKAWIAVRGEDVARRAVLPADDPLGRRLAAAVRAGGGSVTTFGTAADADLRIAACDWTLEAATLELHAGGDEIALTTRLPGAHNALNVAAALAAATALGVDRATACAALTAAAPVAGRLERVGPAGEVDVLVDYAHNPDGLASVLGTVRHVLDARGAGRIVAVASALPVFDPGQYEAMGRVVGGRADAVVATTERLDPDAPLEEPPAFFAALRSTAAELAVEIDRRAAIERAVTAARRGDVVLVLGRGRRRTPIHVPGTEPLAVDDREAARAALAARMS